MEARAPEIGRKIFLPPLRTEVRMEIPGNQVSTGVCQESNSQTAYTVQVDLVRIPYRSAPRPAPARGSFSVFW